MSRLGPRRGSARDANEPEIRAAFLICGAGWWQLGEPGDALCWWRRVPRGMWELHLVEVKGPAGPQGGTSGRELTPAQERFWAACPERLRHVIRTPEEAFALVPPQEGFPETEEARRRSLSRALARG